MKTIASYLGVAHAASDAAFPARFQEQLPGYAARFDTIKAGGRLVARQGLLHAWLVRGWTKVRMDGQEWREIGAGDALVLVAGAGASVADDSLFWTLTAPTRGDAHVSGLHRLADVPDTKGGCNVGENAFRRLQLAWRKDAYEHPDGVNVLGCHVVWIAEATSRTHFHPIRSAEYGQDQQELYLVLDPAEFGLRASAGSPGVWTFPRPGAWGINHFTPLVPGDVCWIPAGVAHRAVDILACVIAIPGFKPDNDIYVDHRIASEGSAPHNENFAKVPESTGEK